MRIIRFLAWGTIAALVILAVAAYPGLPDRIPAHIGLDGTVTRFSERSLFGWFLLPGIAVVTHLVVVGVGVLIPGRPHLVNFPEKARLLALPREFQAPVIEELRAMLDLCALAVNSLMLVIQYQVWRTALGHQTSGLLLVSLLLPAIMTPALLLWLTRVTRVLEQEERRWKSSRVTAAAGA